MIFFLTQVVLATPQVAAYTLFALGIVLIYRASKVLNLAHGVMAMFPAYVAVKLRGVGMPVVPAVIAAVLVGALMGAAVEWVFVRRLRRVSETAQTVGTVAAYGLVVALTAQFFGTAPLRPPGILPDGVVWVGGSGFSYDQIGLIVIAIALTVGLFALFKFTALGLAMRGSASNRTAAGLMGIDPDATTRIAWMMGGGLAAVAGVMLSVVSALEPFGFPLQALPGFVAALIGGLGSMPGALAGAAVVGFATGAVPGLSVVGIFSDFASSVGASTVVLALIAFVVMARRGERLSLGDVRAAAASAASVGASKARRTVSGGGAPRGFIPRRHRPLLAFVALAGAVALGLAAPFSVLGSAILGLNYALVAISLVILTGWVGQISLGQAAFVGIGAFSTGVFLRSFDLPFPLTLFAAGVVAAGGAALLGLVALRVRGLFLAVATLIFAWMAQAYLFNLPSLGGSGGSSVAQTKPLGSEDGWPYFDFTDRTTFYFVALATLAGVVVGLSNLRDSKTGRAWFAVKGSEVAAASLGIDVMRSKLAAFAVSGFVAGVAGNLLMTHTVVVSSTAFTVEKSLFYLAVAVVGGLTSLGGAVASGALFASLEELFYRFEALARFLLVVSTALLAIVLLFFPAGLAGIPRRLSGLAYAVRDSAWLERAGAVYWGLRRRNRSSGDLAPAVQGGGDTGTDPPEGPGEPPSHSRGRLALRRPRSQRSARRDALVASFRHARELAVAEEAERRSSAALVYEAGTATRPTLPPRAKRAPVLAARDVTVRFGGLTAVDSYALEVREGEIVGLIGPNGAGKTTLFNALSGLNEPTSGEVELFGEDITTLPVHERAARGMGRTFQILQLFPDLTVFDNLMVATHTSNPTGFFDHLATTRKSVGHQAAARTRVRAVIELAGIQDIAEREVAGLPFGTLRLVELARALVTGAPFIMLDEPASGLDNTETDRFMDLLMWIRERLGITMLLIEHDMRVVMGLADHVYVVERGKKIAEGPPAKVQRDPAVIAAYLGAEGSGDETDGAAAAAVAEPVANGRTGGSRRVGAGGTAGRSNGGTPARRAATQVSRRR
jgi:sulfate-transporting ATPase